MSLLKIRSHLARRRGSLLGLCLVLLTCLMVVVAHSGPTTHDMDGATGGMSDAASICLAVLQVAGGLALAGTLARLTRRRPHTQAAASPAFPLRFIGPADSLGYRIRPGPVLLQVFRR